MAVRVLTDTSNEIYENNFVERIAGSNAGVARRTVRGGLQDGLDLIEVDNGKLRFTVVPGRGMGLWKAWLGDWEIGWNSPVDGPVHPKFVPVGDPSGLGWLEGFDELLCRCGLESNGAPEFGSDGNCKYPLHGRIANRPAHRVEYEYDPASQRISIAGEVDETRFLFKKLRLKSTYLTKVGENRLKIVDEVTNLAGSPAEMQLLYHINFGPPVLDPGAKFIAPVKTVVPRDPRAAEGIRSWDTYPNEQAGFAEQVYFFELLPNAAGQAEVLLKNAHGTQAVSLAYPVKQLPYFTLWKNTGAAPDGYVTGLEPGTNFPNPRSYEGEQKRVVKLAPGETAKFETVLTFLDSQADIAAAEKRIVATQGDTKPKVFDQPQSGWTKAGG